jgi:hypothetical protein
LFNQWFNQELVVKQSWFSCLRVEFSGEAGAVGWVRSHLSNLIRGNKVRGNKAESKMEQYGDK